MDFVKREPMPIELPIPIYVGPTILQKSSIITSSSTKQGPLIILDFATVALDDITLFVTSVTKTGICQQGRFCRSSQPGVIGEIFLSVIPDAKWLQTFLRLTLLLFLS